MNRRRTAAAASRSRTKRERTPDLFFNRELSWLAFNERVAEEAADKSNPLIERAKFAAIVASNLDEFFMVRVAGLRNAIEEGDTEPDPSGLTPAQQLRQVSARVHALVARLYALVTGAGGVLPRRCPAGADAAGRGHRPPLPHAVVAERQPRAAARAV